MVTSTTRTLTTVTLQPRTGWATPNNGTVVDRDPATALAGSQNPGCESSESGRADASILRDEEAISRPYSTPLEYALSPEGLCEATKKCCRGTDWKNSVSAYELNSRERNIRLSQELIAGTYIARPPMRFTITRPKTRPCLSVGIRDRVYQRSLCDNVVYPAITRGLIPANCACQKGKGTDYAISRLKKMSYRHWCNYGLEGYVLKMDIAGYYPNMRHDFVLDNFRRHLDEESYKHVESILSKQYAGEVGFEPGSQLVQLAGISALDGLDHFIKERLHIKAYVRYMDDMICICRTREELEYAKTEIEKYLARLGWALHPSKTHIQHISKRIAWLGYTFELKNTGYIVVRCRPEKIRDDRRRFRRINNYVKSGRMTEEKAEEIIGTTIRRLWKNCTNRADPIKLERYWTKLKGER